jgi:undecaprenyl-diphosphatase
MPSGHSTASFACAVPFFSLHPALGLPMTAYAATIATSRVHLRAHNPSDVIMGASIGVIFALPVRRLMRRGRSSTTLLPHQ